MNDEDRFAAWEKARTRLKAELADPSKRDRLVHIAGMQIGMHLAQRGEELPETIEGSEAFEQGVREGHLHASLFELAIAPRWYTNLPLIGRIIRAVTRKKREPGA